MPKLTIELPIALSRSLNAITDKKESIHTIADERFEKFLKNKESVSWAEVSNYLARRAAGETPPRPTPKKFIP